VVFLAFALDNEESLLHVRSQWLPEVREYCQPTVALLLVGLRHDLRTPEGNEGKLVKEDTARTLATEIGAAGYFEVSPYNRHNFSLVFQEAMRAVLYPRKQQTNSNECVLL